MMEVLELPRPDEVTQEMIDEWDAQIEQSPPDIPKFILSSPKFREVYHSGEWLALKLREMGMDDDAIQEACFSSGQKMFFSADPWGVVESVLSSIRNGEGFDAPGEDLAHKLNISKMMVDDDDLIR